MATPGLLKITVFWNKGYDVIIPDDDVTTKFYQVIQIILQMRSCDQSLVTLAFLWEKLFQPQFYKDLTRKTTFFERWSWLNFNNLGLALGTNLKFYNSVAKELKLSQKVLGANSYVCRNYMGKTGGRGGGFLPLPHPE